MAIVFIHRGASAYLEYALRQAKYASPESEIVLLGDASNASFPATTHVDLARAPYATATEDFDAAYVHLSTNRRAFEEVCFQRWFWLRAWMHESDTHACWTADSDVMLYAPEAELTSTWAESAPLALQILADQADFRWCTTAGIAYWTRDALDAFCAFVLSGYAAGSPLAARYAEKWAFHTSTGAPGGVCDMTALYLFLDTESARGVANLCEVREGVTCDFNTAVAENEYPDEYEMRGGLKATTWDSRGVPHVLSKRLGRSVRFHALHFAGQTKPAMAEAYQGPAFARHAEIARRLRWTYGLRRLASRAIAPVRKLRARLR